MNILLVGISSTEKTILENFIDLETACFDATSSYEETEHLLRNKNPLVTICDAEIYGLDARKVCQELIENTCIFLSSRDRDQERRKSLLNNRDCYLTRPYSSAQLKKAVQTALAAHKQLH